MQPEASPIIVYTIREFTDGIDKLVREHIFVGQLIDDATIKGLNDGRKEPTSRELRPFFSQYDIKYHREKAIQKYYPVLLELNDSWNDFYYKIREALKIQDIYLWSPDIKRQLTQRFVYKNDEIDVNPNPFIHQEKLDRLFTAYGSLKLENDQMKLVRDLLKPENKVLNLVSKDVIETLAKNRMTGYDQDMKVVTYRYFPPDVRIEKPYYDIDEAACLTTLFRDETLPVNETKVSIDLIHLEQCTIHINPGENREPFINLEAIFQLVPMDDILIFAKLKKGDRSRSKVSKQVQKFKTQVTRDDLAEWSNIYEHHRGLVYRRLKDSPGLVIYKIRDNGFIELQINWTVQMGGINNQIKEIQKEVSELNRFLDKINKLHYQLPEKERMLIQLADEGFMNNPSSKTYFTYFNFKTHYDTSKQQISWNAMNYLLNTFDFYFKPIFNWRVFNQRELRREIGGISEVNFHYVRTSNNLPPSNLTSILFSLGLVGSVSKEQTVTVDRQKDLIVEQQEKLELGYELDRNILDDKIREIKDGNPGVLVNMKFDNNMYSMDVKGAHNLLEIMEISYLVERVFKYYFQIGMVYKYIKNYNCQNIRLILSSEEKIEAKEKSGAEKKKAAAKKVAQEERDIFDIEEVEAEEEIAESVISPDGEQEGEEYLIARELVEVPADEEVKATGRRMKGALDYLQEVSNIFKTEYRRFGCTQNLPVVMSASDFFRNYKRLIRRFDQFKRGVKPKDMEDYHKKFKKDLESQDPDLDKFRKRVEFVAKKVTSAEEKKLLLEISDIADRYHKGALMKVPLDKKKTQYSKEYFYFCPLRWCFFCRESRLSDEVETGKPPLCKICGNQLYQLPNQKNSFIGFPSSKRDIHINCLPCCFKNKSKFENKIAECNVSHPIKRIPKPKESGKPNISYPLTGNIIPDGRVGYLDGEMSGPLNDFFNDGILIEKVKNNQTAYLLKGVNDVGENDAFLEAISHIIAGDKERIKPADLRESLANALNIEMFFQLNNGLIATIFKNPENDWQASLDDFKLYLVNPDELLNEDLLWHYLSLPEVLKDNGLNILIIRRSHSPGEREHKYTMLCPIGIKMEDYFDPERPTGILLKIENKYYPINKITCQIGIQDIIDCSRDAYEQTLHWIHLDHKVADLYHHAITSCQTPINELEKDVLDLNQTVEELDQTPYLSRDILTLILNPYFQVSHILLRIKVNGKNKYLKFPIKPSPIPIFELSKLYKEFDEIDPQLAWQPSRKGEILTLSELFDVFKVVAKRTRIPLQIKYYLSNSKNKVYGIKLDNGMVFNFEEIDLKDFKKKDYQVVFEEDPDKVDLAIKKLDRISEDERKEYVNRTTFQKESFQRLRFEISRYFSRNEDLREEVLDILNDKGTTLNQKRKEIEKIVGEIVKNSAKLVTPDLKGYEQPQIRTLCENLKDCGESDPHCVYDKEDNKCKVALPKVMILPNDTVKNNSLNRYVVLISDEILRNVVKRTELLNGKVSIYVNPSQMVYHVEKEILVDEADFATKISELYAKTTDYTDLLYKNYYLEPSEIFTREVEQNLWYLDETWYKNTGLSKNDYVMNKRNAYEMLKEILGEDIGEQLWSFIEKNDWKLWLNAFREIAPDEFGNIYQYSQFMEHMKYGRSSLTDLHMSLISRLNNIKMIVMNPTAIGSKKFHCLDTTQAQSTTKTYLIFYRDDENDIYVVGRTPHLDLTIETDIVYLFKEDRVPQKFFKSWYDQCPEDHKIQKKPDPANHLIKDIPLSPEYETFVNDLETVPDITQEKIIKPPKMKKPELPFSIEEESESESEVEEEEETPKKIVLKGKIEAKKETEKKKSPGRITMKKRPGTGMKKKDETVTVIKRGRSRSVSKKKESPRGRSRSTSKKKPEARGRSRSTSKKKPEARGRSRSTSKKKTETRSRSVSKKQAGVTLKKKR